MAIRKPQPKGFTTMNLEIRTETLDYISRIDCILIDTERDVYYSVETGETITLNGDGETCSVVKH